MGIDRGEISHVLNNDDFSITILTPNKCDGAIRCCMDRCALGRCIVNPIMGLSLLQNGVTAQTKLRTYSQLAPLMGGTRKNDLRSRSNRGASAFVLGG